MRGIRGAITVEHNNKEEIWQATRELLLEIIKRNEIATEDIASCIFTVTKDLTDGFPARGARGIAGFEFVPLLDLQQLDVDGALERCIRVLMFVNTDKSQREVEHVYLGGAQNLRKDLAKK